MNNREANWYSHSSHPPACSCAICTNKRLNAPPPKSKPQPYNAKKSKKKVKQTKIQSDDWSKLLQALKPEGSGQPEQRGLGETKTQTCMCPACGDPSLCLGESGRLYECNRCACSYPRETIEKAPKNHQEDDNGGEKTE